MKTIHIKYSKTARDICAGQRGDHRMAQLALPLPAARLQDIQSAVAIFDCDGVPRLSQMMIPDEGGDAYLQDGKAYITLTRSLTRCQVLRVQLECYGPDGDFIDRSPISERIKFEDSIVDSLDDLIVLPEEPDVIHKLIEWMHQHINLSALDNITTSPNGLPLWDGAPWPGSTSDTDLEALLAPLAEALDYALGADHPLVSEEK